LLLSDLKRTGQALIKKNYVPKHTERFFTDIQMLKQALHATMTEPVKEYSCTLCGITMRVPKKWAIQHHMGNPAP